MGNEESETMDAPPIIRKIKNCLNLIDDQGKDKTRSMIHHEFAVQIGKADGSKIDRNMSPFCPLDIEDDSNWITTCFISPAMLIASPLYLVHKNGYLEKNCKAMPIYK